MKKSILLSLIAASVLVSDDYLPLSKIADDKKLEYNFITIDNTVIDAKEIKTDATVEEPKLVETVEEELPEEKIIEEKTEIQKPVIIEKEVLKKEELILKDEVKIEPVKQKVLVKENSIEKTSLEFQREVFFTAAITYSPITAELSGSGISLSSNSNAYIPEAELQIGEHKITGEYFKNDSNYLGVNLDTTWYKVGYRYAYLNANIGADLNYFESKVTSFSNEELFPSFEIDFNHSIENIDFSYGAGYGKNNNIDYSYDYFLNIGIKPYALSDASLVAGYKNRTIQQDDEKLVFKGPYIGVKSRF